MTVLPFGSSRAVTTALNRLFGRDRASSERTQLPLLLTVGFHLGSKRKAKAIDTVFAAIHAGDADPKLLAYQYLQVLPQIAQGESGSSPA